MRRVSSDTIRWPLTCDVASVLDAATSEESPTYIRAGSILVSRQCSRVINTRQVLTARLENGFHFSKAFAMFLATLLHTDCWGWSSPEVALNILLNPYARANRG